MAIIELKLKNKKNSHNTFTNDIRIAFSTSKRSIRTGKPLNVLLIWVGLGICKQIGLKDTNRLSLEIDTDNPHCFLIKKDPDGYKVALIASALRTAILWRFDIPNNIAQTRVVRHEITPRGIMIYMNEPVD